MKAEIRLTGQALFCLRVHECAADAAAGARANFYAQTHIWAKACTLPLSVNVALMQLLQSGRSHADPHLSKVMHTADRSICILDAAPMTAADRPSAVYISIGLWWQGKG